MRDSGLTLREIGTRLSATPERIRQILIKGDRLQRRRSAGVGLFEERGGVLLTERALNCLLNYFPVEFKPEIIGAEQVAEHLETIRILARPGKGQKNLGKKTLENIEAWLHGGKT